MNLALHIFRKDVRHFYPEILLNLALLAAFAWTAPALRTPGAGAEVSRVVPSLLRTLLPVGWFLLISRLVHDEVLVGDRQFWVSRPYRWGALLGEKVLFVLAFLHLPLFFTQAYLLHHAGFAIGPAVGDLLLYQLAILAIYVLPFAAIGAVTATFGGHVLFVLGGLVYILATVAFGGWLAPHKMTPPHMDAVITAVAVATLAGTLVMMYARRRTMRARVVLLCLPPALLLVFLGAPAKLLIAAAYPAASRGPSLAFDPDPNRQQPGSGEPLRLAGDVALHIPVQTGALPAGELVSSKGVQLTVRAADGYRWSSAYQSGQMWFASGQPGQLDLFMPARVYDRLRSAPVVLEVRIAAGEYSHRPAQAMAAPAMGQFPAPEHGSCAAGEGDTSLQCQFPLRNPGLMEITAEVQDVPCPAVGQRHTVVKVVGRGGLSLDFDPVVLQDIAFHPHFLCPGAHVRFAPERLVRGEEILLRAKAVRLPLYVTHSKGL